MASQPYCDVCNRYLSTQYNFKRHLSSIAHKNKINEVSADVKLKQKNPNKVSANAKSKKNISKKESPRESPNRISPNNIINSFQNTVSIYYEIDGEYKKIFSYTLNENDDISPLIDEINEAIKPVFEIISLSKEMEKTDSNKKEIQKKIDLLNNQLNINILNTQLIKDILNNEFPYDSYLRD